MKSLTNVYIVTETSHHFNLKTYGVVVKNKYEYLEQKKNSKRNIFRPTVKEVNPKETQEKIKYR